MAKKAWTWLLSMALEFGGVGFVVPWNARERE
jgi:hypothetical protein